jgi:hypothetical protein
MAIAVLFGRAGKNDQASKAHTGRYANLLRHRDHSSVSPRSLARRWGTFAPLNYTAYSKHDVEQRLTAESLGRQLAERESAARAREIEQLRGQIAGLSSREPQG